VVSWVKKCDKKFPLNVAGIEEEKESSRRRKKEKKKIKMHQKR